MAGLKKTKNVLFGGRRFLPGQKSLAQRFSFWADPHAAGYFLGSKIHVIIFLKHLQNSLNFRQSSAFAA
jgi:hypothetical protein